MLSEEFLDLVDRPDRSAKSRMSVVRIVYSEFENLGKFPSAVVFEKVEPGIDCSGDRGSESPCTGYHVEAFIPEVFDARPCRSGPLPHHDLRGGRLLSSRKDTSHISGGTVEVWLNNMQQERSCYRGIKGVSTSLEDCLRSCCCQPMR